MSSIQKGLGIGLTGMTGKFNAYMEKNLKEEGGVVGGLDV